jgi:flagellar hook-associated protein 1
MSLSQALLTSTAGLRTIQSSLALVSANVANAETPGYVRKALSLYTTTTGSVNVAGVNRTLDEHLQRQLRTELAGGGYAATRAAYYDRIQLSFGQPGSPGTLEAVFNDLLASLQALEASPESYSARTHSVNAASLLASQLNRMSGDIQSLRAEAESGLANSAAAANEAMNQIAHINQRLAGLPSGDSSAATLMDQRDRYVSQLAELMDIRVLDTGHNQISVFTNSGVHLVGLQAATLKFDTHGTVAPHTQWSADPAARGVGTLVLVSPNGDSIDLLANKSIRSGKIAALVEMRDRVLVEAQTQLDAIAAAMAQALSSQEIAATPASAGPLSGFDIDLAGLLAGNTVRLTYTDVGSGEQRAVTFVRVDNAAVLPLSDEATVDPDDRVFGIDFSGGMANVVAQISAALGPDFTVSNPSGMVLRVLDDGGVNVSVDAMAGMRTTTGVGSGDVEFPLFTDGGLPYSGAIGAYGSQLVGFAGRISVNPAVLADPNTMVKFAASTLAGDTTRPDFILERLSSTSLTFPPQSGIGNAATPYQGSLPSFLRQVIFHQGEAAAAASQLSQGQSVVVNALQERFNDVAAVNIDQELAYLLQLQSAYSANARVLSAVRDMLDTLLRM